MRRVWMICRLAGLTVLGCLGCTGTPKYNEFPTEHPNEVKLPPEGQYAGPPQFPKETLNQFPGRKDSEALDKLPPVSGMRGGAGGGRMGGP